MDSRRGIANDADLRELEEILGHRFARPKLLEHALTHGSIADKTQQTYERLEFLGDRVLGLVVADLLFHRFKREAEGALGKRFAALVSRTCLSEVAVNLGLGRFLRLSPGESESGGRENPSLLADACEAVIAALYLDGGLDAARRFIEPIWTPLLEASPRPPQDPKTALQEWAQGRQLELPNYKVIDQSGPDHAPNFLVRVAVTGHEPETGEGKSKRMAERAAADRLLDRLRAQGIA